ncbi:MAG: hemerythrin domain-containing protein [Dehalococcoidia bacterium]|nr:hemerythrin domain-containing protein [Dehalococcoidia bacterium]
MADDPALSAVLEREHRDIDENLALFTEGLESGEWRVRPLETAGAALRRHIYLEEELLFPSLRDAGQVAPVAVMLREHGDIWLALDELEQAAVVGGDGTVARRTYERLQYLLEAHNDKEEQILYPQADVVLDAATSTRLRDSLEHGTLPGGWVCADLR